MLLGISLEFTCLPIVVSWSTCDGTLEVGSDTF